MIKPNLVLVEGGSFEMGSNDGYDNQKPIHEVTLSSFYIGQFTVTQKEWEAVMGSNPSEYQGDNLPITHVSWNDVQEFIAKLNLQTDMHYRLPTEAEWEYAARGGNKSNGFKYAGSDDVEEVAWHRANCNDTLFPVGQKKPNELGLYDMSGNVFEWCQDWYGDYPSTPQMNPKGPNTGSYRVLRGGSWDDHSQYCRINYRSNLDPNTRYNFIGFRLAHDSETFNQPEKSNSNMEQLQLTDVKERALRFVLEGYQHHLRDSSAFFNGLIDKDVIKEIKTQEFLNKFSAFISEVQSTYNTLITLKDSIDKAENITEILETLTTHYFGLDLNLEVEIIKILINTNLETYKNQ